MNNRHEAAFINTDKYTFIEHLLELIELELKVLSIFVVYTYGVNVMAFARKIDYIPDRQNYLCLSVSRKIKLFIF